MMFLIKFFLKLTHKAKLKVKIELIFSFLFLLIATSLQSLTPLAFRNLLNDVTLHEDATVNILIYGLLFKIG